MKKLLFASACVVALAVFNAGAAPDKTPKVHAPVIPSASQPASQDVTLTGTICKSYPCACVHIATYTLTGVDSTTVKLPTAKGVINLDNFVGIKVTLTGAASEKNVNGKRTIVVQKITTLVKVPGQA